MSLLDRPRHSVTVFPQVTGDDGYGGILLSEGAPVVVPCNVQPVSVDELEALGGVQARTVYRVVARSWPGGIHSRIRWMGDDFDQVGEAQRFMMSPRTSHFKVFIRARSAEVI